MTSRTDFNNNVISYGYDLSRNLETSRTEANGTSLARTINTAWHPTFRLPVQITEPGRTTVFAYDNGGNLTRKTAADTTTNQAQTWAYTYNGSGQLLTIDGPRNDAADVTTYSYYTSTDQDYRVGDVASIQNALGHVTQITAYDAHGHPLTIVDPNGLVATLTYDLRGRLTSRTVGELTTSYAYDGVGQLTQVTLPNGGYLMYTYDAAHRVTDVQDQAGNHIHYTLDLMGNLIKEDVYDPAGNLVQTHSRVFDALNRLWKDVGAQNQTTVYSYDNNGNLTSLNDPLSHATTNSYDALNRFVQATAPGNGITRYGYNPLDQLISVTDPRNLATIYTTDAFGNISRTQSPDAGSTSKTYDTAGNVLARIDGKGQMTSYQYDALNRLIQEFRTDGNMVTYTYDTGPYGIGRLTGMIDPSGTTSWTYDIQGRVIGKTQVIGGVSLVTRYVYDTAGQLVSVIHPSGVTINYNWTNGQLTSVSRGTAVIASGITYHPFGPVKSWTFGNGQSVVRTFDLDGRMTAHSLGTLGYDAASRITGVMLGGLSILGGNKTYGYDAMDRLTSFSDATSALTYTYDAAGNRTGQTIDGNSYTYSVSSASNRLDAVTGPESLICSHDANGSVIGDGQRSFTYDAGGRLTDVAGLASYSLNGFGQRVRKNAGGVTTLFAFDEGGRLAGEYGGAGNPIQETVWLGDLPLAVLKNGGTYYIHTDHLNTPRQIHDAIGQAVWAWDVATFGVNLPNENPSGLGTFPYNPRYPGQYYDSETGLHYNYFRDYDPKTGRYIQSDPIGLAGGINTYAYVKGNPLRYTDPRGTNPLAGAIEGAEIGTAILPGAGTVVGGLVGAGIGWWIADKIGNISFAKPKPGSKPKGCPAGTKPIDQIPGLDKDDVHGIKDGVGAGPRDWTGIAPNGDVITGDSNGDAVNHGPYSDYLP